MREATPNVRIVSSTEAQTKFGEMIKRAYVGSEHLIVEKSGMPVVAIIPIGLYNQCIGAPPTKPELAEKLDAASERAAAAKELQGFLARVHAKMPDVDEDEAERLILHETMAVRRKNAKEMLTTRRRGRRPARAKR